MFWTTGVILTALAFNQVSAALVASEVYNENVISGETIAIERIGWGWNASPGQFPFMVQVRFFTSAFQWRDCGGSIIHNNWVVSSAYCATITSRTHARIFAGVTDISSVAQYISDTSEWWIHPLFDVTRPSTVQSYDILILRLQQPLFYTIQMQPIRIEPSANAFNDYANELFITMGWGSTPQGGSYPNVLNWVYLRGISSQECRAAWPVSTDYHICAEGFHNSSQSTCTNDEGGPLIRLDEDEKPVLVAVTNFAQPCSNGRPSGFNRISPLLSWVNNITGIDFDEVKEPPTTEAIEPPTTEAPEPPTTEETDKDSNESGSSESEEDPEISELLKNLQVKVKVKVKVNSIIKKNVTHSH